MRANGQLHMLQKLKGWFRLPYPYLFETRRNLLMALGVGLVIFLLNFLLLDEGYALRRVTLSKLGVSVLAGGITALSILLVIQVALRYVVSEPVREGWTVGREVLLTLVLLVVIAFFNRIVFSLLEQQPVAELLWSFLLSLGYVLALGLLPIVLVVWVNYTTILRRNLRQVSAYNEELQQRMQRPSLAASSRIQIPTQNKREVLLLDLRHFLLAKAEGNYVDVVTEVEGKIQYTPYRLSIQTLMEHLQQEPSVFSPHRSYVVNLHRIGATSGNARNFRLHVEGVAEPLPVSRSKYVEFKVAFFEDRSRPEPGPATDH